MNQAKIIFRNIYCTPVSKEHINKGWLSWMNNPITAKQINKKGKKYTEHDLENYLKEKKSIFFLFSGGTFLIRKNTNDRTAIATMSLIIFLDHMRLRTAIFLWDY